MAKEAKKVSEEQIKAAGGVEMLRRIERASIRRR